MVVVLVLDLFIVDRPWNKEKGPRDFGIRQATWWAVFYIAIAVLFGFAVMFFGGTQAGVEYFAGFVTEKSLSIEIGRASCREGVENIGWADVVVKEQRYFE